MSHAPSDPYQARRDRKMRRDEMVIAHWIAEVMASADADHPPCRLCISGAAHRLELTSSQRWLYTYVAEAVDVVAVSHGGDPFARSEAAARRYRSRRTTTRRKQCSECDSIEHTAARCPRLWERRKKAA